MNRRRSFPSFPVRAALAALLIPACLAVSAAMAPPVGAQSVRGAERLHFDDILAGRDGERVVELYVRVLTRYGEPVTDLTGDEFVINDAGERIDSEDIQVKTLSATGAGMACVVAIDISRTMRGEPFERARNAALDFVRLLDARDRVAIVTFSDEVRVPVSFSASRSEAIAQLELLEIDDQSLSTVLYDGIHKAIELIRLAESLPRRAFVIVFSDGKDAGSQRTLGQVTEFGRSNKIQPPVLTFSIGYSRFGGDGLPILEKLSADTDGNFVRAESPIQITSFFNTTRRQMRDSLVITYPGDLDGEDHEVDVTLENLTASRTTPYPAIRPDVLPWIVAVVVVLLVIVAGFFAIRGRSKGRLIFKSGPLAGQALALQQNPTRLGALPDNDIVLPTETISRYHAAIHIKGSQTNVQDLDSQNGTYVNENKITNSPIEPGDRIRFADVEAVYER